MSIKKVASIALALIAVFSSSNALAKHNYKPNVYWMNGVVSQYHISNIENGYTQKVRNSDEFKSARYNFLQEGGSPTFLNKEDQDPSLLWEFVEKTSSSYVKNSNKISGEICAMINRYGEGRKQKSSYYGGESKKVGQNEPTPFYDSKSTYYKRPLTMSSTKNGIRTTLTVYGQGVYKKESIKFGIHAITAGDYMDHLAFTIVENYEYLSNGVYKPMLDQKDIVSLLVTPVSRSEILHFKSEKQAYNACSGKMISSYNPVDVIHQDLFQKQSDTTSKVDQGYSIKQTITEEERKALLKETLDSFIPKEHDSDMPPPVGSW